MAAVEQLDLLAQQALADSGIPGLAVGIVHDGEVVFLKGYGVREAGKDAKVDEDTRFQVASVSKPISSTLVALLVGKGLVSWDDPVSQYLPDFALSDPYVGQHVTLRDFFSHRSGLSDHAGDVLEDLGFKREEIFEKLRMLPLENRFRTEYAYTNFGVTAAAQAVANAAGMSWEDLIEERLFLPLGMTSTSARFSDFQGSENHAPIHLRESNGENPGWFPDYVRDPDAQSPAGGVSSSVRDLTKWMLLQLANGKTEGGESLVDELALMETRKPHMLTDYNPATGKSGFYGLGWGVGTDDESRLFLRHSGEFTLGLRSLVSLYPAGNLGIVVLANAAPNGIPEGLGFSFYDLVFEGKPTMDWVKFANQKFEELSQELRAGDGIDYHAPPAEPEEARTFRHYTGEYGNDFYGTAKVQRIGAQLFLTLGPGKVIFPLKHYNADTFFIETTGEMAAGNSGVIFEMDEQGKAKAFTVNLFNLEDLGRFERLE